METKIKFDLLLKKVHEQIKKKGYKKKAALFQIRVATFP